jgi:hypothetical protein
MNDIVKTLIFVVAATVMAVVAALTSRSLQTPAAQNLTNQLLYPDFTNPQSVASLEVVKFDETRGEVHPFKVAQLAHKGKGPVRWSIPSHDEYPADAKDQVASAATALMGLKILSMVSDNKDDEREYGVVDPPKMVTPGATGVGERVVMRDKDGKELLALIVGKEVANQPNLRYVRKVGGAEIYVVSAKTDKLSTKFEDWIEPNLLKINTIDLQQLSIRDYSIRETSRGLAIMHRGRMQLGYNDAGEPHWKMLSDQKFAGEDPKSATGKWLSVPMDAGQELAAAKLDELKTALDDLKIVDVSRKPAGLSADLKVGREFASNEAVDSLADKGFFPAQLEENGPAELFSNEGEIRLAMKDGVEYVLRFGQITGSGPAGKDTKKGKDAGKDKDKKSTGLNRYLFVMAEFDPSAIPKPQFEKLPDAAKTPEPEKKPDDKAAKDKKPEAAKPPVDKKAEEAERARIEKDNKRKQEEYDQQIADGKKKVAELNARFADWYYVISDEVYRKIHLGRDEIVVKKPKKDAAKGGKDAGPAHPGAPVAPVAPATPIDELEKLKGEGPAGK